jgi:hypothetical protein
MRRARILYVLVGLLLAQGCAERIENVKSAERSQRICADLFGFNLTNKWSPVEASGYYSPGLMCRRSTEYHVLREGRLEALSEVRAHFDQMSRADALKASLVYFPEAEGSLARGSDAASRTAPWWHPETNGVGLFARLSRTTSDGCHIVHMFCCGGRTNAFLYVQITILQ